MWKVEVGRTSRGGEVLLVVVHVEVTVLDGGEQFVSQLAVFARKDVRIFVKHILQGNKHTATVRNCANVPVFSQ